jgi:hypothetical protein
MGAQRVTSESDIVERLRAQAADVPITLALDAAVEIERLRMALPRAAATLSLLSVWRGV